MDTIESLKYELANMTYSRDYAQRLWAMEVSRRRTAEGKLEILKKEFPQIEDEYSWMDSQSQSVSLALPEDGVYIIRYADKDEDDDLFAGHGARENALYRYEQRSQAWTCQLFVMVKSSGYGSDSYPVAQIVIDK